MTRKTLTKYVAVVLSALMVGITISARAGADPALDLMVAVNGDALSKVGHEVDYGITVTNTGDATLWKQSILDSVLGDLTSDVGCGASLSAGESCTINVTRTVQAGDPDPLVNTAQVIYDTDPSLLGSEISRSDDHSVNLFQPAVEVIKDGPETATSGETITYHFTINNLSSGDSPGLVLDSVTDTVLSDLTATASANGCGMLASGGLCELDSDYTIQLSDPSPLVNVVTVHYHPDGFPNDITDDDGHSIEVWRPAELQGKKFEDLDADGVWDAGEPGLAGVEVTLDGTDFFGNPVLLTDVTDANGVFSFSGLVPGEYSVTETAWPPGGWIPSTPISSGPHILGSGDSLDLSWVFGNYRYAAISGTKVHDLNANGLNDGEPGLGGWTIYVDYNGNGSRDAGEPFDVTAGDGGYQILDIDPGTWTVREELQAGWLCSFPNPGTPCPVTGAVESTDCSYTELFDSSDDLAGDDFGNWTAATKRGRKFHDLNANGVNDGEPGLSGWTIYVDYDGSGTQGAGEPFGVTDVNGDYYIINIAPGVWTVREIAQVGWTCSYPNPGTPDPIHGAVTSTDCSHTEVFDSDNDLVDNDFGAYAAPVVSVVPASQTVQYSDEISPLTLTAMDNIAEVLTAATAWSADGVTFNPGLPDFLVLSPASCIDSGEGMQTCTWTVSGVIDLPEGIYTIRTTVSDNFGGATAVDSVLNVVPENAWVRFDDDNPVAEQVGAPGGNSGTFSLTAYVTEKEPDLPADPAAGVAPGEISRANVTVTLVPVGPGPNQSPVACSTSVAPVGYAGEMTVVCDLFDVPVNTYTVEVTVDGGYYSGTGEDVLVVFDPSLGFTTGGFTLLWPGSEDSATGYPGDRTNGGYTMKYNRRGTKVQGSLLLIRHLSDGSIIRLKSNSLFGLAIGEGSNDGPFGWATFAGKATYRGRGWSDPLGNYEFSAYVEDHGEPGAGSDRFWIEIKDRDGIVELDLSMARSAADEATTIVGGNIVVPHNTGRTGRRR